MLHIFSISCRSKCRFFRKCRLLRTEAELPKRIKESKHMPSISSLKWLRVGIATVLFSTMAVLFLDFTETVPISLHVLANFQIVPAILAGSAGILSLWILLALLFGRVYCSTICPFGILMDVIGRIRKTVRGKKAKFEFRPQMTKIRISILVFFMISMPTIPVVVSLFDPYSNFGRIVASLFQPLIITCNNFLAWILGNAGGSTLYFRTIQINIAAIAAAAIMLTIAGMFSFFFGRRYCNTICPVGTLLGLMAKFSLCKIRLKSDCVSCGLCERACKGECIDSKNKTVDASRCVTCFNCLTTCRHGAIAYSFSRPAIAIAKQRRQHHSAKEANSTERSSRRRFFKLSLSSFFLPFFVAGSKAALSAPPDPSLPTGTSRVGYETPTAIIPPGASDLKHFSSHCTACHLCVSKCPTNILTPSTTQLGLSGFLQPVVEFDHGFCNYDCSICTQVCPTGALTKLKTVEEKHLIQIGRVVFVRENCVVNTQETNCGACAEHCPTGAVKMIPYGEPKKALTIPETDADLCVGCGACEYICPVRPYRAIYVDGLAKHQKAKPAFDPTEKQKEVQLDDFGF